MPLILSIINAACWQALGFVPLRNLSVILRRPFFGQRTLSVMRRSSLLWLKPHSSSLLRDFDIFTFARWWVLSSFRCPVRRVACYLCRRVGYHAQSHHCLRPLPSLCASRLHAHRCPKSRGELVKAQHLHAPRVIVGGNVSREIVSKIHHRFGECKAHSHSIHILKLTNLHATLQMRELITLWAMWPPIMVDH